MDNLQRWWWGVQAPGNLCHLSSSDTESGAVLLVLAVSHRCSSEVVFQRAETGAERSVAFPQPSFSSQFTAYSTPLCSVWIHPSEVPGFGAGSKLFSQSGPACSGTGMSPGAFPLSLQMLNRHQEHQPLQISLFKVLQGRYLGTNRGWMS